MLKLTGAMLIVFATTGMGIAKGRELQMYLKELEQLRQVFLMLKSEIKYTKSPLGEAFFHIGKRIGKEQGTWLLAVSEQMEKKLGITFFSLWTASVDTYLNKTKLKRQDLEQIKALGMNMGYLDEEMQIGTIDLYLEQLEIELRKTREELVTKRKLCNCLGVMGGIFLVIVLI